MASAQIQTPIAINMNMASDLHYLVKEIARNRMPAARSFS